MRRLSEQTKALLYLGGLLVAVAVMAAGFSGAGEAGAVEFVISYVEVQNEVRPKQATWSVNKSVTVKLHGGNAISDSYSARTTSGYSASLSGEGKFRDSMVQGARSQTSWRVQDSNTLVRTWARAQHTETMRLSVSGKSCSATISYRLKPGFREYMTLAIRDRQPLYFSSISAQNISCRAVD